MSPENSAISYSSTGVNYDTIDPIKRLAQLRAKATASHLQRFGSKEVDASRGESAYVWEERDVYKAFVIEGLGTKNLVADETRKITGKTYYDSLAQDTVAMIINDLIVVGASPQVINAYFAVGSSNWFADEHRATDLVEGWAAACNLAGVTWGGGETPALMGVVNENTIELAGAAVGEISPKDRLVLGNKLVPDDKILLIESNGIHANGLTLARKISSNLPQGYAAQLSDGASYGESLLKPTHIYSNLVRDLFNQGIDIHYMVNITGHGWRKLMRANEPFTYVLDCIPTAPPVFSFIQDHSGNSDEEMYGNFNMGAGFAIFVSPDQVERASQISQKNNLHCLVAGQVEKGSKQVIIKPKNLIYKAESLGVR